MFKTPIHLLLITILTFALTGCESLPGTRNQQGATIGGATGAAAGAAVGGSDHRLLGAVIGGVLGAGGGYVIAANTDAVDQNDKDAAAKAAQQAKQNPATAQDARSATTADINQDGFVTMDEILALSDSGLTDDQVVQRLKATNQVFDLTEAQEENLTNEGVSLAVIREMRDVNQNLYGSPSNRDDVISRDPSAGNNR